MLNEELINKYKIALELCNSKGELSSYTRLVRETLYKPLQPDYTATIDEVVWAECFINRERFEETTEEDSMMLLKNFTKNDWDAFKGAEMFGDGNPPMIASKYFIPYCEITVVVDNLGVHIFMNSNEEPERIGFISGIQELNRRFKVAIGNEVCSVIDSCLSLSRVIDQLKIQLDVDFERSD